MRTTLDPSRRLRKLFLVLRLYIARWELQKTRAVFLATRDLSSRVERQRRHADPFVKGAPYLRKIEAKSPEELAVTQLKGIELLYWVLLLSVVLALFTQTVHDVGHGYRSAVLEKALKLTGMHLPLRLGIPTFQDALARSVARKPCPWYICWASLIAGFFKNLLALSVWGNQIVACCRMGGFRALRNTHRPLESRTIAEFWNWYYFYLKELLVEFFFYPTYTRYLRGYKRARLFESLVADLR